VPGIKCLAFDIFGTLYHLSCPLPLLLHFSFHDCGMLKNPSPCAFIITDLKCSCYLVMLGNMMFGRDHLKLRLTKFDDEKTCRWHGLPKRMVVIERLLWLQLYN